MAQLGPAAGNPWRCMEYVLQHSWVYTEYCGSASVPECSHTHAPVRQIKCVSDNMNRHHMSAPYQRVQVVHETVLIWETRKFHWWVIEVETVSGGIAGWILRW